MALEDLGLSEEQMAAVNAEISGLKIKNDELLGEKASSKEKAALAEKAAEEARAAATKAHEEKLKQDGDIDALKAHFESQLAESTAAANEKAELAQKSLNELHFNSALNGAMSIIHDDFKDVSSSMLSNMIEISYNEKNEPITSFKNNGEIVANNVDEFKGWASEQPSFKRIIKGVESSGAGAKRSGSSNADEGKEIKSAHKILYPNY